MAKKSNTPLGIFTESIGLYFTNFDKFVKYMTFPVLGQVLGLSFTFLLTYFYSKNIPVLIAKFPTLDNPKILFTTLLLLTLPGLIIFCKAFWEYLIAYGSINSMVENLLKSGKVYDFEAHTERIKRRTFAFIELWLLLSIFSLISACPLFWVPCGILAIYFILIFQTFTFEPNLSPFNCAKKSLQLIKGHFASTFMLVAMVGALTYILIPEIFKSLSEYINLTKVLSSSLISIINVLPIEELNNFLSYFYIPAIKTEDIALFIVGSIIAQIFIQYTLPLRSILWCLWYKQLNNGTLSSSDEIIKKKKKSKKRPSEKLMDSTNKKFASKKLDKNILKRAMEKED